MSLSVNAISSGQQPASADNPRLGKAAHEFEASLMKEFLKPLEHDSLFDEKGDDDSSDGGEGSAGALMSYGSQALATAISERGGFGIATKILDHFRTAHATTPTKAGAENKGFIRDL
jgi:peptidoglycan hydrolase FlgJ